MHLQKKTLFLLAGILVVLVIALAVTLSSRQSGTEAPAEAEGQALGTGSPETEAVFSALTYDNGSATLSFHLDESGKWVWSDDPEFPLDDSHVQAILALLTDLHPQQTITDGESPEAYGLDEPFATLTATRFDGSTLTIALGNTTTDGNSYYMLKDGQESPVYIISDQLYTYMSETIYDMCDLPDLPELTAENIRSVSIEGASSTLLRSIVPEDAEADTAAVTWAAGGEDVTGLEGTSLLLEDLTSLHITRCVDYKPSDEAAELCGFTSPRASVSIIYTSETGAEGTLSFTLGTGSLDGAGCYLRLEGDTTIYQVDAASVDALLTTAESGLPGAAPAEEAP